MKRIIPVLLALFLIPGCGIQPTGTSYRQISTEEAVAMMEEESNYIILDVRTEEEYNDKHIANAINIPNEAIGKEEIPELQDKEQLILVYCRSGNRSKQASQKLAGLGYTNIVEFGGINDWTGETVTGNSSQTELSADSQTRFSGSALPPSGESQRDLKADNPAKTEGEVSAEDAFDIVLNNAGVPKEDANNIKNERDSDNGIPIHDIEFETDYGDYDFEVAIADGRIVGADYEVDEEYLDVLGGSGISLEDAQVLVSKKVEGSDPGDVEIWEENEDGHSRFEGELYFEGMKYEFEIDPAAGRIFDWNADLRD